MSGQISALSEWFRGGGIMARVPVGFGVNSSVGVRRPRRNVLLGGPPSQSSVAPVPAVQKFDPNFATVAPPVDLGAPDSPGFDPAGGWEYLMDAILQHNIPTGGLPSGGGLMIGPQEAVKGLNTVKNFIPPLMAGDVGLAGAMPGWAAAGRTPLPVPFGQVIKKGKGAVRRALRALGFGGDVAPRQVLGTVDELVETAPAFHTSGTYDTVQGRTIFNEPMYTGRGTNPQSFTAEWDPFRSVSGDRNVMMPGVWTTPELNTARGYGGEAEGFVHAVTWKPDRAPRAVHLWDEHIPDDIHRMLEEEIGKMEGILPDEVLGVLRGQMGGPDFRGTVSLGSVLNNPNLRLSAADFGITDPSVARQFPILSRIQEGLQSRVDVLLNEHGYHWLNPSDLHIAASASNVTRPPYPPGAPLLGGG